MLFSPIHNELASYDLGEDGGSRWVNLSDTEAYGGHTQDSRFNPRRGKL